MDVTCYSSSFTVNKKPIARSIFPIYRFNLVHSSRSTLAIALVCLLPCTVEAASPPDACGPVIVMEPHTPKTSDSRPNIAWEPIPGASAYKVKLDSRIPEGEKVFSAEVQVSTSSFLPAKALTESRAHVSATITAICGTADGIPTIHQFDIDTGPACGTDSNIRISNASGKRQLLWVGPKSAQSHNFGFMRWTPASCCPTPK